MSGVVEVAARYVVNCSMLFPDLPLLLRPRAARDAGFEAVEFWWPFDTPLPGDADVERFVRAIDDAGVTLTALNFTGGDMTAGERGVLSDPARSRLFRDSADIAFGIADRLGTKAFNALYGNRMAGLDTAEQDEVATENLRHVGRIAGRGGAVILLEPLSGVSTYPLRTAAQAIAVMDRVGEPALRLLADLYHLSVNGDDIAGAIEHFGDRIGHVQIADDPGRGEPGTGSLDLERYLALLGARGYCGNISLEYRPSSADPFEWLPRERRAADPWDQSVERSNS